MLREGQFEQVREASASFTALVPIMKAVELHSSEDNLAALVRELLRARLHHLGWSVPDHSKGGLQTKVILANETYYPTFRISDGISRQFPAANLSRVIAGGQPVCRSGARFRSPKSARVS